MVPPCTQAPKTCCKCTYLQPVYGSIAHNSELVDASDDFPCSQGSKQVLFILSCFQQGKFGEAWPAYGVQTLGCFIGRGSHT